jgi:hypothetical protein
MALGTRTLVDHMLILEVGWDDMCIGFTLRLIPAQPEYCIALESYLSKNAHPKNKSPETLGSRG